MGLLNKGINNSDSVYVSDCVGKVGYCEYVTDPKTDKLYKNTILFEEKTKREISEDEIMSMLKADDESCQSCDDQSCDDQNCDDEKCDCKNVFQSENKEDTENTMASAFIEILKKLDNIENLLKK